MSDADDTVGLYLKEVGRVPLLTAEQEVSLAKRIERGQRAREVMAAGAGHGPHAAASCARMIEDGWAAREHLITANSRLVISVAKKYMGRGVPFLDLIQEGNIGLIRAAKKFDYRRGHKFSTYATWWIRQAVTRAIADQGRTIRVPVHMGDQINKLLRVSHQLTQRLGRDPSTDELADALEVTPKKVENMIQVARRPLSLETPTDEEEDSVLGDFIEDEESPAPAETVTHNLLREHLQEVLNTLPPREVRILQLRYGLLDGQSVHAGRGRPQDGRDARARAPDRGPGAQPAAPSKPPPAPRRLPARVGLRRPRSAAGPCTGRRFRVRASTIPLRA